MSALVAVDLDRTMIFSEGALGVPLDETFECVEMYEGKPLSYMSIRSMSLLRGLSESVTVVPTTTRTIEQFQRIGLPGAPWRYAITSNGGNILVDGEPDTAWRKGFDLDLAGIGAELRSRVSEDWVLKYREADGLFCYLVVDVTAVALYMNFFKKYWAPLGNVDQWVFALAGLVLVLGLNLVSVKVFGELEFWFALIKVVALVTFLAIGTYYVIFGTPIDGQAPGLSVLTDNGGLIPNGLLPAIVVIQGVVFAYASIELVGTAAGETQNPEKVIPKAINTVIVRIVVFYVGSVLLLSLLLPYTAYQAGESPFVTFFGAIDVEGADAIMNLVVLTAALSSLNAGLYSTGRILHSMAVAGSAPKFAARMNKQGVPYGGIALTSVVTLLGVVLNA
ncbi:amino acid permease, partial [Dietzia cinnamea]|uniref:amino acid permease n=1 Tax=Dietzia cinnamea TaxID=321318 RepID=UPI0031F2DDF8